ncbi:MAG TPA: hypothetical protein VK604_16320 [Bryobacteraceae bacterium]|nr:hypothetical protein [Bryobacteraceae bacterium]
MTRLQNGLTLAAVQTLLAVSVPAKFAWDRATRPRVWVKTVPYDPMLPFRGRYVSLRLAPAPGSAFEAQTQNQRVAFFLPEHAPDPSRRGFGKEVWVEVTIPRSGPPRPIQLGIRENGRLQPLR